MIDTIKDVYTTREAAKLLGVSLRTVQLWVENGTLIAWKTAGGHRRISHDSLEQLMIEQQGALKNREKDSEFKILIIEDDSDLLDIYNLRIELWDLPIKVQTAVNGYEGLIKIGEQLPDIVIVDLILPNIDGFQLIRTLKDSEQYKDIQIIVVSGLSDEDIEKRGGIDKSITCLHKPLPFARLQQLVLEIMSKKTRHSKSKN